MNYFGECCYGDEELFEEIMNPFYRSRNQVSILKRYEESTRKKINSKEINWNLLQGIYAKLDNF